MSTKVMTRILASLITAALLFAAVPMDARAATCYVRVTSPYTYIYKEASTGSTRLRTVGQDVLMLCGAVSGNWTYVKYDGVTGYALKSAVTATSATPSNPGSEQGSSGGSIGESGSQGSQPALDASSAVTALTTKALKLFRSPSVSSSYYGTIAKGKTVACYKTSGDWAYIKVGGYVGYVLKDGLAANKNSGGSSSSAPVSNAGVTCYVKSQTKLLSCASEASEVIAEMQVGDKILVTHSKADWCRVITTDGKIGYLSYSCVSKTKVLALGEVVLKDWFTSDIQSIFSVGSKAVVTDVETKTSFTVYRKGGTNHADCEPLTSADTAAMLAVYGGAWSWDRRPIWVTINGVTYAASMNGMNHGEGEIYGNDFEGHFCMHFVNSRTHGSNKVDADHQSAIKAAYLAKP